MQRTLIKGPAIVSMDPAIGDLRKGDALIENDAASVRVDHEGREALGAGVESEKEGHRLPGAKLISSARPSPSPSSDPYAAAARATACTRRNSCNPCPGSR